MALDEEKDGELISTHLQTTSSSLCSIPPQLFPLCIGSILTNMKVLFLCTAHNSLSQRLYLTLSTAHDVSIEYAVSDEVMISAVATAKPDIILCPFLTTLVPKEIYDNYLTLIVHPGPPGDAGPSALDWLLLGDDGSFDDANHLLQHLDRGEHAPGRTHWGVTVLQAIEQFDAGPVWAFEQFTVDIDQPGLTKSEFYRGLVTTAAIIATVKAMSRIHDAAIISGHDFAGSRKSYNGLIMVAGPITYRPHLQANPEFGRLSVSDHLPFQGGILHHRPLLKAVDRDFDLQRHTAEQISRRLRCADSQPGVMSGVFGRKLYLYGGVVEEEVNRFQKSNIVIGTAAILATRNEAICLSSIDGKGVWITHTRRPKGKTDKALWPKVPATFGLQQLGLLTPAAASELQTLPSADWSLSTTQTLQDIWIDINIDENLSRVAYLYFDFYNGAMSTSQCSRLIDAMDYILSQSTPEAPLSAVVLMGGSYFGNGIALNVIEASDDPAVESWLNINRIDDVAHYLLHEFPSRGIRTVAAIRGNAAAGGVALASACDIVIAGAHVVLNPAYRAVGLYGSEYHTLSYFGRCGQAKATKILRVMTPMSTLQAHAIGLIDFYFPGNGAELEASVRSHVSLLMRPGRGTYTCAWKARVDLSPPSLARTRAMELSEMSKDFWSPRAVRYHSRRYDFVRKVRGFQTPLRFATHRRLMNGIQYDEEELDSFDDVAYYEELAANNARFGLRKQVCRELSALVSGWAEGDVPARAHRRGSVALIAEKGTEHVAKPGTERREETVFSCYYKPVEAPLTPPMSPMEDGSEPRILA